MWYQTPQKDVINLKPRKENKELDKTSTDKDLTFCINDQPASPATKTIRVHVCSATNSTVFQRKLKIAPTALPTMVGNASTAFPVSLLSTSANLFNHFFKTPSSFGVEPLAPSPPPKTPVMVRTIVEIVIEKAAINENMVIPWSRKRVRILSANFASWSRTFAMICLILILGTCVWRSFRFCDSIFSLACFSVFKSSNLYLYNCICSSVWQGSFCTSSNFLVSLLMRLSISVNFEVYLSVHPVCFVKRYRYPKTLTCRGRCFDLLLVS